MAYGQAQTGVWRGGGAGGRGRRFRRRRFRASDRAKQATLRRQPPTARGRQTGQRGAYNAQEQVGAIEKAKVSDVSRGRAGGNIKKKFQRGRGGEAGQQFTTGTERA
jgi:hypothetical protein